MDKNTSEKDFNLDEKYESLQNNNDDDPREHRLKTLNNNLSLTRHSQIEDTKQMKMSQVPYCASSNDWENLHKIPNRTKTALYAMVERFRTLGKSSLVILMLGKTGTGKSSTINTILNEKGLSTVGALTSNATEVVARYTRTFQDFELVLIDTPGLLKKDTISKKSFRMIKDYLLSSENAVDVVLYCERIDLYRIEPSDQQVIEAITNHLGNHIWQRTLLTLTRAGISNLPKDLQYNEFIKKRIEMIRQTIKQPGKFGAIPAVLVENLRASKDSEGEMILPNGTAWLPELITKAVELVESGVPPFQYNPLQQKWLNPNNRAKWMIPFVLFAQLVLKVFVFDQLLIKDNHKADLDSSSFKKNVN